MKRRTFLQTSAALPFLPHVTVEAIETSPVYSDYLHIWDTWFYEHWPPLNTTISHPLDFKCLHNLTRTDVMRYVKRDALKLEFVRMQLGFFELCEYIDVSPLGEFSPNQIDSPHFRAWWLEKAYGIENTEILLP